MRTAGVLFLALSAAACRSPTQITFQVTTDLDCASIQSTSIVAGPLAALSGDDPPTTTAPKCTSDGHIGSLVVVPSGADDEQVAVKIVTGVSVPPTQCGPSGEGCIVAKRALRFEPHAMLTVNVGMDAKCEGIDCPGAETCVDGFCRSAVIDDPKTCESSGCDDTTLPSIDGGAPSLDGGDHVDATLPPPDGSSDAASDAPLPPSEGGGGNPVVATSIGISANFACALLSDHTVSCWGNEQNGELGNGVDDPDADIRTPVHVPGLDRVTALAVGEQHACVVFDDGGVSCWGFIGDGATGTNHDTNDVVPAHVSGMGPVGLLSAGQYSTCAASADGHTIWCWGIYTDEDDVSDVPALIPSVSAGIVELRSGREASCGRFDDGVVRCWGKNSAGVLGQGATPVDASAAPLAVPGAPNPRQISMAYAHACAVDTTHVVRCWGENDDGQIGAPVDAGGTSTPTLLAIDPHVMKVVNGVETTCALFDDAGTLCWGYDYQGELGVADTQAGGVFPPTAVPNLGPASDVFAGGYGACAILVDAGVACWGNNLYGQLGAGAQLPDMPIGAFNVTF